MYHKHYRDVAFAQAKLRQVCQSEEEYYRAMQLVAERRKQVRECGSGETESESIDAIYDLLRTGIELKLNQTAVYARYAMDVYRYYREQIEYISSGQTDKM